jgi:integrase
MATKHPTSTPKAPNGSGSVTYDRSARRWVARMTLPDGRRPKRTAPSEREAWQLLDAMLIEAATGKLDPSRLRVAGVVEAYRTEVVPARQRSYSWRVNQLWALDLIEKQLGERLLAKLSVGDVDSMLKRLGAASYSRESLIRVRSVGGQVVEWALRRDLVQRNVFRHAELPEGAARTPEKRSLTPEQAGRLVEAIEDERNGAMYLLALSVGVRPGELLGLTWEDVDLDAGVVHVRRALRLGEHGPEVASTLKTNTTKAYRSIRLAEPVVAALRRHRAAQAAERLELGAAWGQRRDRDDRWPDLVFTTTLGTPIRPESLRRSFSRITLAALGERWTPNELRHSAASLLSAAGVRLEQIADVLGHVNTRMTGGVYRHATGPVIEHAAAPMNDFLGRREPQV